MTELPTDGSHQNLNLIDDDGIGEKLSTHGAERGHARMLRCRTVAMGRLRQQHHIRNLEPIGSGAGMDGSATLLSQDDEPHPSEMLLASLGACLTASIQANAVARGIPLRTLEVHTGGKIDSSALWGTGARQPRPLGFTCIIIEVHVEADVPRVALKSLVDYAVLWSPVANTLHDPVHLDVVVVTD